MPELLEASWSAEIHVVALQRAAEEEVGALPLSAAKDALSVGQRHKALEASPAQRDREAAPKENQSHCKDRDEADIREASLRFLGSMAWEVAWHTRVLTLLFLLGFRLPGAGVHGHRLGQLARQVCPKTNHA